MKEIVIILALAGFGGVLYIALKIIEPYLPISDRNWHGGDGGAGGGFDGGGDGGGD